MMLDSFSLEVGAGAGALVGFLLGYGVRAWISRNRRRKARGF
jgi:hypothetical protein